MTSRDFVYWLQGMFELADPKELDAKQVDLIKRHLAMVFIHEIDPSTGATAEEKAKLDAAHAGEADVVGAPSHGMFAHAAPKPVLMPKMPNKPIMRC